jgi:hypothetical protein
MTEEALNVSILNFVYTGMFLIKYVAREQQKKHCGDERG